MTPLKPYRLVITAEMSPDLDDGPLRVLSEVVLAAVVDAGITVTSVTVEEVRDV